MIKAYVAGPYSAETGNAVWWNITRARTIAESLWKSGFSVFCPHLNSAHMEGLAPITSYYDGDIEWLKCAELLVLLEGWEASPGTVKEFEVAADSNLIIWEPRRYNRSSELFWLDGLGNRVGDEVLGFLTWEEYQENYLIEGRNE